MTQGHSKPLVGITMGDPAGIGPEVVVKALAAPHGFRRRCTPVVVGDRRVLERTAARLDGLRIAFHAIDDAGSAVRSPDVVNLIDLGNADPDLFEPGEVSGVAGAASIDYVTKAARMALQGELAAIVTAPINKESVSRGGCRFPGHTELLAEITATSTYAMLLVSRQLRVIHVSTHISLRQACDAARKDRVLTVIRLAAESGRLLGIPVPKVAVAGLNPHAGEGGLFGTEESQEIVPAIEEAAAAGIDVSGPWPPDTVFLRASKGEFDVVVAMYHDQGHIPMKLLGFEDGVNVSMGLPIIRTSVDHGTAFDIVGKNIASERSLVAAIDVALQMIESKDVENR